MKNSFCCERKTIVVFFLKKRGEILKRNGSIYS